jgi:hypothetical protein
VDSDLAQAEARLEALLRARCPLVWVASAEEERFERLLTRLAERLGIRVALWSVAQGLTDVQGESLTGAQETHDPTSLLRLLGGPNPGPSEVYLLRDLDPHLTDPVLARRLRELVRTFRAGSRSCVLISAAPVIPPSLVRVAERYRFPLPSSSELRHVLQNLLSSAELSFSEADLEAAASAAVGLTEMEAETLFACALVEGRSLDPAALALARDARIASIGGVKSSSLGV